MADFYMKKVPNMRGEHETDVYPKMVRRGLVTLRSLAVDIEQRSTFTKEDVIGVVSALKNMVAERVADGYGVKVDGIGIFSASLVLAKGVIPETSESESRRSGRSVCIGKVNFKADKELVADADSKAKLRRVPEPTTENNNVTTRDERLALLLNYLKEKHFIKVSQYAVLTGLNRTKAAKELRAFSEENTGVTADGSGSYIIYMLK